MKEWKLGDSIVLSISHFNSVKTSLQPYEAGPIIIPVLLTRKLESGEINNFSKVTQAVRSGIRIQTIAFWI